MLGGPVASALSLFGITIGNLTVLIPQHRVL